jgi:hypothetical protein
LRGRFDFAHGCFDLLPCHALANRTLYGNHRHVGFPVGRRGDRAAAMVQAEHGKQDEYAQPASASVTVNPERQCGSCDIRDCEFHWFAIHKLSVMRKCWR